MVRGDPRDIWEEFKRHVTNTKTPSKKRFFYKSFIILTGFIFLIILTIFVKDPISEWTNKTFFTQESNLTILVVSRDGKELIEKYGEDKVYEVLNPTFTRS